MVAVGLLLVTGAWDCGDRRAAAVGGIVRDGDLMTQTPTRDAPGAQAAPDLPRLAGRWLRFLWTQLTSMRTALVLLFALALAAVPGLAAAAAQRRPGPGQRLPHRSTRRLGPIYDRVGLFARLHLALVLRDLPAAVRLAGRLHHSPGRRCTPGRSAPGRRRTPRNLSRLPAYATADRRRRRPTTTCCDAGRGAAAATALPGRSARETAWRPSAATCARPATWSSTSACCSCCSGWRSGTLYGFRGTSVVIVGQGFANNLTQYDDFTSGARFTDADLMPFSVDGEAVRRRSSRPAPVQRGRGAAVPGRRRGHRPARGARRTPEALEVNQPLNIDGTTVHLIGHGYAPMVTVKDGQGNVAFSGPVVVPAAGRQLHLGRGDQGARRPAGTARRSRPSSCRPRCSTSSRARGRSSPTRSTRRCSSTSGPARRRSRPAGRRTSTPWTPPG